MSKKLKIGYWVSTALLCALTLLGAVMYFAKYDEMCANISKLGFPAFILIPLGISKIAAVVTILWNRVAWAKEWAYAGLTFVFSLAISAHLNAHDGEQGGAIIALVLAMTSYTLWKMAYKK